LPENWVPLFFQKDRTTLIAFFFFSPPGPNCVSVSPAFVLFFFFFFPLCPDEGGVSTGRGPPPPFFFFPFLRFPLWAAATSFPFIFFIFFFLLSRPTIASFPFSLLSLLSRCNFEKRFLTTSSPLLPCLSQSVKQADAPLFFLYWLVFRAPKADSPSFLFSPPLEGAWAEERGLYFSFFLPLSPPFLSWKGPPFGLHQYCSYFFSFLWCSIDRVARRFSFSSGLPRFCLHRLLFFLFLFPSGKKYGRPFKSWFFFIFFFFLLFWSGFFAGLRPFPPAHPLVQQNYRWGLFFSLSLRGGALFSPWSDRCNKAFPPLLFFCRNFFRNIFFFFFFWSKNRGGNRPATWHPFSPPPPFFRSIVVGLGLKNKFLCC